MFRKIYFYVITRFWNSLIYINFWISGHEFCKFYRELGRQRTPNLLSVIDFWVHKHLRDNEREKCSNILSVLSSPTFDFVRCNQRYRNRDFGEARTYCVLSVRLRSYLRHNEREISPNILTKLRFGSRIF